MTRLPGFFLPACVAVGLLTVPGVASAQSIERGGAPWRQRERVSGGPYSSKWTLEVRFGGYYPQIDEEPGLAGTPYKDYFGTAPQFYFGLEADWTPIRIPYVGRLGPAFGWGITTMGSQSRKDGAAQEGTSTGITIHAMHLSAALRIDEIARRTVIPIVPYAKLGFGLGTWSSGTSTGTSGVGGDCGDPDPTDCKKADGMSIGPHIALGGMLGLNWLDPRSSSMARENSGIQQVSLFGEWMWANLNNGVGKDPMFIGTSSWVIGLAFDL
jgi:hypothetical protein